MRTILDRIVEQTREDLQRRKKRLNWSDLDTFPRFERARRGFRSALIDGTLSVIAEVKRASPSKGIIREPFDPVSIARSYERGGASCISVLTDEPFFKGSLRYLEEISDTVSIPLLRKDFLVDPWQVKEARAHGADAVLVIAAVTSDSLMDELLAAAKEFELDVLLECYNKHEVDRMDWNRVNLFGVNNRDLNTFDVDLHRGVSLLQQAPEGVIRVSESGLSSAEDLAWLSKQGIHSALIGEHFMRAEDPGKALGTMLMEMEYELNGPTDETGDLS
ncbi:MAG: indole-3-glycerol phosphate synthase TrpC [Bacteroidota bacterium]